MLLAEGFDRFVPVVALGADRGAGAAVVGRAGGLDRLGEDLAEAAFLEGAAGAIFVFGHHVFEQRLGQSGGA